MLHHKIVHSYTKDISYLYLSGFELANSYKIIFACFLCIHICHRSYFTAAFYQISMKPVCACPANHLLSVLCVSPTCMRASVLIKFYKNLCMLE